MTSFPRPQSQLFAIIVVLLASQIPEIVRASPEGFNASLKAASLQFGDTQLNQQQEKAKEALLCGKNAFVLQICPLDIAHLPTTAVINYLLVRIPSAQIFIPSSLSLSMRRIKGGNLGKNQRRLVTIFN